MAESTGEVVRQRNREAPFPSEINRSRGELEEYFADLGGEREELLHYDELPDTFTSVGLDQYPAWFAKLTEKDPAHNERAAYLFLRDPIEIIYPTNPEIGTEKSSLAVKTKKPKVFFPIARVHSHPDTTCFSPQDFRRAMGRTGIYFEENEFISEIVGTPKNNFLLLRTEETEFDDPEDVERILESFQQEVERMHNFTYNTIKDSVQGQKGADELAEVLFDCQLQAEEEIFGADYARYYTTIAATHQIASDHKLGFYVSNQDGIYRKFTDEDLQAIRDLRSDKRVSHRATEIFKEALEQSRKPKD